MRPTVTYNVGGSVLSPQSTLTVADVNRDRRPDVVVANPASGEISVFLTRSGGRLAPARRFPATAGVSSVAAGDLDRDGNVDLMVGPGIAVLRGDSSGGFGAPLRATAPLYPTPPNGAFALADLNNDSLLDVVVVETGGLMSVFGDGTGALIAGFCCSAVPGEPKIGFGVGDLNSDPFPDVAFVGESIGAGEATLMFGDGAGHFTSTKSELLSRKASSAVIRDFNSDSHLDLAILDGGAESIGVWVGDGLGGFKSAGGAAAPETGPFELADVNGDRRADIVQVRSPGLAVALARVQGGFDFPVTSGAPAGDRVATGDLDLDGRQDVLLMNTRAGTISVVRSVRPIVRATCRRPSQVSTRSLRCDVWRSPAARRAAVTLRLEGPMLGPGTRGLTVRIPGGRSATTFRASRAIPPGVYLLSAIVKLPTGSRVVGQAIVLR
jgi:hypothetical protein